MCVRVRVRVRVSMRRNEAQLDKKKLALLNLFTFIYYYRYFQKADLHHVYDFFIVFFYQTADLQRRNEELLDLQRNHEAFREKFILFREGMRSKTDESDARFRKLEAELAQNRCVCACV